MMTLEEALHYLQGSAGVNWLIGFAWSYILELIPGLKTWYGSLSKVAKRAVIALFSLGVPLLCFVTKLLLGLEFFTLENLWMIFLAWGMAFFGSHVAHTIGPGHPNRLGGAG